MVNNFDIWKEEFDEICKLEIETGANRDTTRRLLIFTEGFSYKIAFLTKEEMTPDIIKTLEEIQQKNSMMIAKKKEGGTIK